MTGQCLKEKILLAKVPLSVIAERLGITAQSLNSCFKGKDVRSNTIERIAEVLDVDMSFFYPMEGGSTSIASGNGNVAVTGNNNDVGNVTIGDSVVLQERIKALEAENKAKDLLLDEKERTIQILMKR